MEFDVFDKKTYIEITIIRNGYGSQFALADGIVLFQFDPRNHDGGKQWYFWPTTNFNPTVFETDEFPIGYFTNLCRAKYFLLIDHSDIADSVKIVNGEEHLKWKCDL